VLVKIELTPDAAHWVEAEIAAGTFVTPEDAVRYAINLAKLAALRAKLDAAVAAGGDNSVDDVRSFVRQTLDTHNQTPKVS
jgi:Arc/MetJ-type ribon-helix-helix transcriptional regulator